MPLSVSKLQDLLASKGFVPNKYFVMDGLVFYVELVSVKNGHSFLLYMPSKYEFSMSKGSDMYKVRYVDMESSESTTDEYAGSPENVDIESAYGGASINLSPDKNTKIEEHLEDNYRRPILLTDISSEDRQDLKSIYRQMRRLRYCVQNIKYQVGIIYKNYICAIRRDDSIDCFGIKHYPRKSCKRLMVITDLEMFYEKNEKLLSDIETVHSGIYEILQKNQGLHTRVMTRMLESKEEISSVAEKTNIKKSRYDSYIRKLEKMLVTMNSAEKTVVTDLYDVEDRRNEASTRGIHDDIDVAHQKGRLETELSKIHRIKEDIMKNLTVLRQRREDNVLSIDKIMFDNTVMFDCMVKNFAKLKDFC